MNMYINIFSVSHLPAMTRTKKKNRKRNRNEFLSSLFFTIARRNVSFTTMSFPLAVEFVFQNLSSAFSG